MPARGSGLLMRGKRLNRTTKQIKNFVIAADVFAAALDVYKDFGIGDRDGKSIPNTPNWAGTKSGKTTSGGPKSPNLARTCSAPDKPGLGRKSQPFRRKTKI